jgi:hypothetical protein
VAGGVEGLGHAVVLAGLPDDRIGVVLAAVVDSDPDPQGEGGLPLADGLVTVVDALVSGHAVVGIQPVKGPLALTDEVLGELGVGVGELGGQAGVVVAVAGVQVAAEAASDLVLGPVAELVAAYGGRDLQMLQQLAVAGDGMAVRVWWPGWARV